MSLGEMESDCGFVSRMGSCRDGGDGGGVVDDGGGQPCLHWLPSQSLDSDLLERCCDCADACAPSLNFSRVNAPARIWVAAVCPGRGRDVESDVAQAVALVTMSWIRSSAPVAVLWVVLCLD